MGLTTAKSRTLDTPPKGLGARLAAMLGATKGDAARLLRHVETLPLGPKRCLYLVECDGERFLVAAGGEALSAPVPLTQSFAMRPPTGGNG